MSADARRPDPAAADLGAGFLCRAIGEEPDGVLHATVEVDRASPWFAGHFPGDPILPAIGQLDLLHRLRRHRGAPAHLAAVDALRLAEPVRPGDVLDVALGPAAPDGRCPVTLTRGEAPLSRGAVRWAAEPAAAPAARPPAEPEDDAPAVLLAPALPHAPPARFARAVLEATRDHAVCRGTVPPDHASVTAGRAPTLAAVELAAQSAAALDPDAPAPVIGYIVRLRSVILALPDLPAGRPLEATVHRESTHGPLTMLSFRVHLAEAGGTTNDDKDLARGVLGVYLPGT